MIRRFATMTLTLLTMWFACCQVATAQLGRPEDQPPIQVTLYPAAAPVPALKYALLPRFPDQIQGNAAVYYGKVTAEQINFFSNQEMMQQIDHWENEATLEELKQVDFSAVEGGIMHHLDLAARCDRCDWQIPIRHEKFYTILLPEVQQTRMFGRLLSTHMRIQIAQGQYEEAIADARRGYALARNVGEGETLVNGLVGIAIQAIISDKLHTMLQQPDSPNLYWALTELSDPLVDLRKSVAVEMNGLEMSFPYLRDLENAEHSPERWREILETFWGEIGMLSSDNRHDPKVQLLPVVMRGYPMAKRSLIERGFDAKRVEKMAVAQVVLIHSMHIYHELRDDVFKWFFVPYHAGRDGYKQSEKMLQEVAAEQKEVIPIASLLLPAIQAVKTADVRARQQIALLRVLEAMRMHLAEAGSLPETLDQITEVPIPLDPATGKPFEYRLEGEVAHLSAKPLSGWHAAYEIRQGGK